MGRIYTVTDLDAALRVQAAVEKLERGDVPDHGIERLVLISLARRLCANGEARRLRQRSLLAVDDVARAVGCTGSAISLIERGKRQPSADLAASLGALFRALEPPPSSPETSVPNRPSGPV